MLVRGDSRKVDWLVVAAVSAVVVVTGVVAFEVVALVRSDTKTVNRPPLLASDGSSVNRSAYEIPGFATGRTGDPPPTELSADPAHRSRSKLVAGKRSADGTCRNCRQSAGPAERCEAFHRAATRVRAAAAHVGAAAAERAEARKADHA